MKRSEITKLRTARKAARRVRVLSEVRAMIQKVDALAAGDQELRKMRDQLAALSFEIGQLRKRPANRITLQ